jgi:beta-lactamase regulating signal transducer with metallopeptidase domain
MIGTPDIFRWLVDTAAASSALLLLACGVMLLLKQPARRLRVGELALAGCLVLAIAQAVPATRFSLDLVETGAPVRLPWFDDVQPAATAGQAAAPSAAPSDQPHPAVAAPAITHRLRVVMRYWREGLLALYAVAAAFMAGRLLLALRALRRLSRQANEADRRLAALWNDLTRDLRRPVKLAISRTIDRPITFGIRRPVVLIPHPLCRAPAGDLLAILRHEIGHVERRDAAAWLLAAIVNLLLFFLPPLWMIKRQMRLSQEYLADHVAADAAGGAVPYAQMMLRLVQLTQRRSPRLASSASLAVGAWLLPSDLMLRVRHLFHAGGKLDRRCTRRWTLAVSLCVLLLTAALGAVSLADNSLASQVRSHEVRGVAFLLAHQSASGGWLTDIGPAPTALVVRSLLQAGVPADHPTILRARRYVASCRQSDGGYYANDEPAYHTAVVLSMYAAFNDADAKARIAAGRIFLEHELAERRSAAHGWYQTPAPSAGPAAAFRFADPQERAADAILETYGSLTYSRWKSLVYAGLTENDPRVKQATRWLAQNWTLAKHPGTGSAEGLFYYYLAAAKTLRAGAPDELTDTSGKIHDWRAELQRRLLATQSPDGSWVNTQSPRWLEDRPEMVTAYALLALQETRK